MSPSIGGFVYRSGEELGRILSKLAQDTTLQETLAQRTRSGYEQFYARDRYVAKYLDLIDEIKKKKGMMPVERRKAS